MKSECNNMHGERIKIAVTNVSYKSAASLTPNIKILYC